MLQDFAENNKPNWGSKRTECKQQNTRKCTFRNLRVLWRHCTTATKWKNIIIISKHFARDAVRYIRQCSASAEYNWRKLFFLRNKMKYASEATSGKGTAEQGYKILRIQNCRWTQGWVLYVVDMFQSKFSIILQSMCLHKPQKTDRDEIYVCTQYYLNDILW
jgi:hypothetical protein